MAGEKLNKEAKPGFASLAIQRGHTITSNKQRREKETAQIKSKKTQYQKNSRETQLSASNTLLVYTKRALIRQ